MGSRIFKMDPAQGFAAQTGGAAVLLTAAHLGFPLSTTHSITGAVLGAGAAKRLSAVRWGLAGNIVAAWILTLPAAAAVGALTYGLSHVFGNGALGPLLIAISLLGLVATIFGQRLRRGPALTTSPADT
jgi:PiT family inorganic phosphate transporter